MLKIALLDDEINSLNLNKSITTSYFEKDNFPHSIDAFSNPLNLIATVKETKYDLVILDIDMPEMNGIECAKKLKKIDFDLNIIFLSQMENMVFDCFTVHPFAFIRKNKLYEDFFSVMDSFINMYKSKEDDKNSLIVKNATNVNTLRINDIMYIEGNKNYQNVNFKSKEVLQIRASMKDLEDKLVSKGFIRIQKGFLVNALYIRRIDQHMVLLTNNVELPISSKRKDEILKEYIKFTRNQGNVFLGN